VSPSAGSPLFPGVPISFNAKIKGSKNKKLEILWQPHPEISFHPFEKSFEKSFDTTVIFPTVGTYKIWAQIFLQDGEIRTFVGESKQLEVKVGKPKIKLTADNNNPYVGQKVTLKAQEEPKMEDDIISFWWERKGGRTFGAGPEANSPNDRTYSFVPKDTNSVTVTVHAKAKKSGADLGEKSITITAKKYKVSVSKPKRLDKAPWKWDIKQGKAVELPQAIAVFQNAEVHARITPEPKEKVRYHWTVSPKGCTVSAPGSKSTNLSAHKKGSYQVSVKATDKNGIELGKGTGSLSITVSKRDLDVAAQKAKDQKKAHVLLGEARELWKEGRLQQAIYKVAQARKLSGKDKEIAKTLTVMQKQKKELDDKLGKTVKLIKKRKLKEAEKILIDAARISNTYKKYKKVSNKLADAKKKKEEKKKQLVKILDEAKSLKDAGKLNKTVKILQSGSRQFPGNKEIGKLLKETQKQQANAYKKMVKGQKQWKDGQLNKAISTLEEAARIDSSNKKIVKVLQGMQKQKKRINNILVQVDKLIKQKKYDRAHNVLKEIEHINAKYSPYLEMLKKLDLAKKIEAIRKEVLAQKIQKIREGIQKKKEQDKKEQEIKESARKEELAQKIKAIRKVAEKAKKIQEEHRKAELSKKIQKIKEDIKKASEAKKIQNNRDVIVEKSVEKKMVKKKEKAVLGKHSGSFRDNSHSKHREIAHLTGKLTNQSPVGKHTIYLPEDGTLNLKIIIDKNLNLSNYGSVRLYDHDNQTKINADKNYYVHKTKTEYFSYLLLRAGTYYVKVFKDDHNFYYGSYSIVASIDTEKFSNDSEDNGHFETAGTIVLNQQVEGHLGAIGQGKAVDRSDYWKLSIPSDGTLYVDITTSKMLNLRNMGVSIYAYDQKTRLYCSPQSPDSNQTHRLSKLKSGIYYIILAKDPRGFYWGSYRMTTTFMPDKDTSRDSDKEAKNSK